MQLKIEVMDWVVLLSSYLLLVAIISLEGNRRTIGGLNSFAISLFLTPLTGFIVVLFSRRKIIFHHFIKIGSRNSIKEAAIKKTLHKSGADDWVKLKTSEFRIV